MFISYLLALVILYIVYRINRWAFRFFLQKDEISRRAIRYALMWGAVATPLICAVFALLVGAFARSVPLGARELHVFEAVLVGPLYEELVKAVAPFAAIFWLRNPSGRTLLVIGAMSGLGFFLTESALFLANAAYSGGKALAYELTMRGIALSLLHPICTALSGLGLGLAARSSTKLKKIVYAGAGLFAAYYIHFFNNGTATLINNGHRIDQSELFGQHFFLFCVLLAAARIKLWRGNGRGVPPTLAAAPVRASTAAR